MCKKTAYLLVNSNKVEACKSYNHDFYPLRQLRHLATEDLKRIAFSENGILPYLLKGYGDMIVVIRYIDHMDEEGIGALFKKKLSLKRRYEIVKILDIRREKTIDYIVGLIPKGVWFTKDQFKEFSTYMRNIGADKALTRFSKYMVEGNKEGMFYLRKV